jgi:putative ABC transport system permease protein
MRQIKKSLGRFLAILCIMMIGVAFFAGLSICQKSMIATVDTYLKSHHFFDYQLISPVGFLDDDVDILSKSEHIANADGIHIQDAFITSADNAELVLRVQSMPRKVNQLDLVSGKMPEADDECVVDSRLFQSSAIGKTISISSSNLPEVSEKFTHKEFKITGTVNSPQYMNVDRGTTTLGSGLVAGFLFINDSNFTTSPYSTVFLESDIQGKVYEENRKVAVDNQLDGLKQVLISELDQKTHGHIDTSLVQQVHVLTREENVGYSSFKTDSSIVDGIAKVLPVFFFLVAALVCMTTMVRMMEEERMQIGIIKSLGYSTHSVLKNYIFYSSSAGIIGCIVGYFTGTLLIPKIIWSAYSMLYNIKGSINYIYSWPLILLSVLVTLICTTGITIFCIMNNLKVQTAALMRPKTPKAGTRVLLERFTLFWNNLSFLHKVSFRNIFRYKRQFFMMLIGIGGCCTLLLAGFGMRDSIRSVPDKQFGEIEVYDAKITVPPTLDNSSREDFIKKHSDIIGDLMWVNMQAADIKANGSTKDSTLVIADDNINNKFVNLRTPEGLDLQFPAENEAFVTSRTAQEFKLKVGDTISVLSKTGKSADIKISGIFENFIHDYVYISENTATNLLGITDKNTAFIKYKDSLDPHSSSAKLLKDKDITSIITNEDLRKNIKKTMDSLDYVILMVILFAASLACIVLYNLININITERVREIATLKVLGFYNRETTSYVFRENKIHTVLGIGLGLLLGPIVHSWIMGKINVKFLSFDVHIAPISYIITIVLAFSFTFVLQQIMKRKITKISMTGALKSVE